MIAASLGEGLSKVQGQAEANQSMVEGWTQRMKVRQLHQKATAKSATEMEWGTNVIRKPECPGSVLSPIELGR